MYSGSSIPTIADLTSSIASYIILYVLTSTFSLSDAAIAFESGLTLNPITIAFEAVARVISVSVIAPTAPWITLTLTSSVESFSRDCLIASTEPCTSALTIIANSLTVPSLIWLYKSSNDTLWEAFKVSFFILSFLASAIVLAVFSSLTWINLSPAAGTSDNPKISTGIDGPADLIFLPWSSNIALILP